MTWSMRSAPAVAQRGADGLRERLVADRSQPPRNERRQPPVLAGEVELVGRRADADAGREDVAPHPRVGAVRVDADREIAEQRQLIAGARRVVRRAATGSTSGTARVSSCRGAKPLDTRTIGPTMLRRPCAPTRAVLFGERAVDRVLASARSPWSATYASKRVSPSNVAHSRSSVELQGVDGCDR